MKTKSFIFIVSASIIGLISCNNDDSLAEVTKQTDVQKDSLYMDKITTLEYDLKTLGFTTRSYTSSLDNYDLSQATRCYTQNNVLSFDAFTSHDEGLNNCLVVMKYQSEPFCIIYQKKDGKNEVGDDCFIWYNQANEPLIKYAYNKERNEYYGEAIYIDNSVLMTRASARGLFCNMSMWGIGAIYSAAIGAATGGVGAVIFGGIWAAGSYFLCDRVEPKKNIESSIIDVIEPDKQTDSDNRIVAPI